MADAEASVCKEDVIDPERAICDAHHHLWEKPNSRYLLDDYIADLADGHNVVSSVYVECEHQYLDDGPPVMRPVGEVAFADDAAEAALHDHDRPGICAGIVGFADLACGRDVADVLDAHIEASPRFRGIRYCTAWDASDRIHNAHTHPDEHLLVDETFRAGVAELSRRGLTFDAWVFYRQIPDVISLAKAFPEMPVIVDHLAGPIGIGPYADDRQQVFNEWKGLMGQLSECGNVSIKLGGIYMPLNGWALHRRTEPATSAQVADMTRHFYLHAIECFGTSRCMFESNFPADRSSISYRVLWNVFKRVTAQFTEDEKCALFHDNAARIYDL